MDAITYIKAQHRICAKCNNCDECVLFKLCSIGNPPVYDNSKLNEWVSIIDQWAKDYPAKTYAQDFLEKFPDAEMPTITQFHPSVFYGDKYRNYKTPNAYNYKSFDEFWDVEME